MPIALIGAFEATYQPVHDVDVAETTGHVRGFPGDRASWFEYTPSTATRPTTASSDASWRRVRRARAVFTRDRLG
ncbi:MAG: hypothetical protein KY450_01775 [Actinobacteria bacterium]|nr:hypothetical protein [Actinomycetota bacterium]